jgi:hypothetical protein
MMPPGAARTRLVPDRKRASDSAFMERWGGGLRHVNVNGGILKPAQ